MKKKLAITLFAVLFLFPVCAYSTDITFTSSGTITDGNVYTNVYVLNNGTVVNMSGGQIGSGSMGGLGTIDNSIFNLTGGRILASSINIGPLSTINISEGTIDVSGSLAVMDNSFANISGGNITVGVLKTYSDSVVNINGGNLNFGLFDIRGEVNIYRGQLYVSDLFSFDNSAAINIWGNNFNYNNGILSGYLLDNNPFTIEGIDQSQYTRFNLIPEPISLLFFGFGLLTLRKQKK
jgi:hypothetical protein